jgi:hypothetical protein
VDCVELVPAPREFFPFLGTCAALNIAQTRLFSSVLLPRGINASASAFASAAAAAAATAQAGAWIPAVLTLVGEFEARNAREGG